MSARTSTSAEFSFLKGRPKAASGAGRMLAGSGGRIPQERANGTQVQREAAEESRARAWTTALIPPAWQGCHEPGWRATSGSAGDASRRRRMARGAVDAKQRSAPAASAAGTEARSWRAEHGGVAPFWGGGPQLGEHSLLLQRGGSPGRRGGVT